jgi:hypothetical protein
VLALWPNTKNIIKGRVVASPSPGRDEFSEFVFTCGLSMHQRCSSYALTNLLFGLCRSVWVIDLLVHLLSPHHKAPACPSTSKVLRAREHNPTPSPSIVFTFWLAVESIKELGGVSLVLSIIFFTLYFVPHKIMNQKLSNISKGLYFKPLQF